MKTRQNKEQHMTIIETIQTAVGEDISRSYDNYIQQAASALQQREEEIKRRITQYAARRGLRPGEINGILEEVHRTRVLVGSGPAGSAPVRAGRRPEPSHPEPLIPTKKESNASRNPRRVPSRR
jgi:hypothetical protein